MLFCAHLNRNALNMYRSEKTFQTEVAGPGEKLSTSFMRFFLIFGF
jgi:hypothetical protein